MRISKMSIEGYNPPILFLLDDRLMSNIRRKHRIPRTTNKLVIGQRKGLN